MSALALRLTTRQLAPSADAFVLPDGSILGLRPPQLPDRETKPVGAPS